MALAEISIVPIGTPSASVGDWIAEAVKVLKKEGIKHEVSPMGTIIEGKTSEILSAAKRMHEAALKKGISRVVTTIRIDDRRDKHVVMTGRVNPVKKRLRKTAGPRSKRSRMAS